MGHYLSIVIVFVTAFQLQAQDIHWSQFNRNPIFQNPGNAGHFYGDYRFDANYRDQWRSVTVPYNTISISADSKLDIHKNFGYGLMLFHDVAGDGNFRTIEFQANLSYLIKLTKDSSHVIRPGINIGLNYRQFDFSQFYFDNQYNGVIYDPSLPTGEIIQTDSRTNSNLGVGMIYEYFRDPHFNISGGVGLYNVNKPDQGFYGSKIERDMRLNIFGKALIELNYDWDLVPGINLNFQGKYREIVVGSEAKYTLIDRNGEYRALYGGLWFRNRDAVFLSAAMDYQTWRFGISYDINFSKLVPASHTRGGLELSVQYILHRFKPKKVVHRICPDYI